MSDKVTQGATREPDPPASLADDAHDASGAPTDAAHVAVGDGTLQGSIPAGLSPDALREIAEEGKPDNSGTS
jgi:hypothetical protein